MPAAHTQAVPDLVASTASDLAAAVRTRQLTALDLVERHLDRIARHNPRLNAIVTLDRRGARTAAAAADETIASGAPVGPLHGVPFVVKDIIATEALRTTAGSRLLAEFVPRRDAPAISRLRRAGAVLLGKSNCPEFALDVHTSNRLFGATLNPLDASVTPGGSSGGDAAALAAGMAAFAIGTDYGGSIRWPAQCCGLAGLRPTPGIVPATGLLPYGSGGDLPAPNSVSMLSRSTMPAPMARSVADLWDILLVMAGPDERDSQAVPVALGSPADVDVTRLACAWSAAAGPYPVREDVMGVVAAAADALGALGMRVAERGAPGLENAEAIYTALRAADGLPDHRTLAAGREDELTESIRGWLRATPDVTVAHYRRLAAERDELRARVLGFMRDWPILLAPVSCIPAFPADEHDFVVDGQAVPRFGILAPCRAVTLLGLPSVSVCCGASREGQPLSVQVIARPFADREAVAVAAKLEEHFGRWRQRP